MNQRSLLDQESFSCSSGRNQANRPQRSAASGLVVWFHLGRILVSLGGMLQASFLVDPMDAQFWALAFAVLGFCLIVAEFFIPSGGMIALSCVGSFVASVLCAHSAWYQDSPKLFWTFSLGLGVLIPSFLVFFLRTLERTSLGNNLLLPKTDPLDVTPFQAEAALLDRLIGRFGTTVTPMNPGGIVRVENERLHAVCEVLMLSLGDPIEVTGVRGNRVVVKRAAPGAVSPSISPTTPVAPVAVTPTPDVAADSERLDFDVPQN